jgi:DNA (cytosine-5)-methyltransferase 1
MGDNQLAVAIENHPADSRINIDDSGTIQTLTSRMGTGGGNVPMVMNEHCNGEQSGGIPFCKGTRPHNKDEAQKWEPATKSNTLNTFDVGEQRANELIVKVYGICSDKSNSMLSDNPNSGII